MKADDFYALERKYRDAPRKGWTLPGSRAKANQTIEVNRHEVVQALTEAHCKAASAEKFCMDAMFYEKMLGALADGEHDAVECDKCGGIFQMGWLDGKCPYCEADHDVFMIIKKE